MPIRNPFARRPGVANPQDENSSPVQTPIEPAFPGFERVDTVGSKASSSLSIRTSRDTGEYKMSVVNDSGVYLPPSPTEREATWPRRYLSRNSTDTRSMSSTGDIEHFSISRESFDSYRRSFDICAKSPIVTTDPAPRQSLDSARFPRLPRSALGERRFDREPPTAEEGFEDVGLNDESASKSTQPQQQAPKKRGFFSKFGSENTDAPASAVNAQMMSRFLPSRKRAQSGQGSELGSVANERPETPSSVAVVPEHEVTAEA